MWNTFKIPCLRNEAWAGEIIKIIEIEKGLMVSQKVTEYVIARSVGDEAI